MAETIDKAVAISIILSCLIWPMFGLNIRKRYRTKTQVRLTQRETNRVMLSNGKSFSCSNTSSNRHFKCKRWPRKLFLSRTMCWSSTKSKSKQFLTKSSRDEINLSVVSLTSHFMDPKLANTTLLRHMTWNLNRIRLKTITKWLKRTENSTGIRLSTSVARTVSEGKRLVTILMKS